MGKPRTPKTRYSLPKRFSAALSEPAYARLRVLNQRYGLGNNYLLTVLLENLDEIANRRQLAYAFEAFIAQYDAPEPKPADRGKA